MIRTVDEAVSDRLLAMALETYDAAIMLYPTRYPPASAWGVSRNGALVRDAWKRALKLRRPIGLYVNIPFCRDICRFCYLPVRKPGAVDQVERYLSALEKEAEMLAPLLKVQPISALYVGGGTPSLLTSKQIERLFGILLRRFNVRIIEPYKMAFETNPESLTEEKLRLLAKLGVNWLSMGIQSFNKDVLMRQNRFPASAALVKRLIVAARRAGIRGIGVDLMCGLEGQSGGSFLNDVDVVTSLAPDQVFLNTFRPLPSTGFARNGHAMSLEETASRQKTWREGFDLAARKGYVIIGNYLLYEKTSVSAVGRSPTSANLLGLCPFYRSASVLGLGSGAISYAHRTYWYQNAPDASEYMTRVERGEHPVEKSCATGPLREMINFIVERLELEGRIPLREFKENFAQPVERKFSAPLEALVADGTLSRTSDAYRLRRDYGDAVFKIAKAFFEPEVALRMAASRREYRVSEDPKPRISSRG